MKERLQERLIAVATAVGYPLFYVFCLVIFATWTFPFEKVKDRIVASFNDSQRTGGGGRELAIADVTSSWVTGVKLSGVRIVDRDQKADGHGELKIDSLVARVALLPLLVGTHTVSFHADAFGGNISGSWTDRGKSQSLEVTLAAIDLSQLTPLTQALEAPVEGILAGSIKLEVPEGHTGKASGSVSIDADDVALGDGKAKLMGKLAVPRLTLGTFSFNADIKDGAMKVSKFGASGKDVDLLADARINLRDTLNESSLDANVRFRVSDAYRCKNDATKGLFGAPGSNAPAAMDLYPDMKKSKRADGFYTWHARGQLGKPELSPGGTGGPPSGPGGAGGGGASAAGRAKEGP